MYRIEMYNFYRIVNQQFTEIYLLFVNQRYWRIYKKNHWKFFFANDVFVTMLFRNIVLMMNHCSVIIHICSENFRYNDFSYMMKAVSESRYIVALRSEKVKSYNFPPLSDPIDPLKI